MIDNKSRSEAINFCLKCGWSISDNLITQLTGQKEKIFYCQKCGTKLVSKNVIVNENSQKNLNIIHV